MLKTHQSGMLQSQLVLLSITRVKDPTGF